MSVDPQFDVETYVRKVTTEYPNVIEMWLFGSRANGTATEKSDWDIFAFTDEATLNTLRNDLELNDLHVDLLVVKSADGCFEKPWGKKNPARWKIGSGADFPIQRPRICPKNLCQIREKGYKACSKRAISKRKHSKRLGCGPKDNI